jgi:hypothetical protein
MTQPPYRPSEGHPMNPMSRLALFTVTLLAIVAIGSQSRQVSASSSLKSMCVCVPTRAGLLVKSAIAKAQARVQSVELTTSRAAVIQ